MPFFVDFFFSFFSERVQAFSVRLGTEAFTLSLPFYESSFPTRRLFSRLKPSASKNSYDDLMTLWSRFLFSYALDGTSERCVGLAFSDIPSMGKLSAGRLNHHASPPFFEKSESFA